MDPYTAIAGRGATTAVVHFSGGNDEGFCGPIKLLDSNGETVQELQEYYYGDETPSPGEKELVETLCAPVYARYGSFAGEFYVDGTVTWDTRTRRHEMHGAEQVSHWEEF